MSKFLRNKTFRGGFTLGIILFLLAQVISFFIYFISTLKLIFNTPPNISIHGFWDIGFPFSMYYGMFSFFHGKVNFEGLIGNILVATVFSFILGLIFKFVWLKSESQKLK
ncbi:MAG TPA: hypothetical protein VK892_18955 [Pyrinomonadaceae bacterium]|nr:hypothetical protein [Pyrinomonadaceae bacterium]